MVVKVLVVDDSGFFRRRVSEILSADPTIKVINPVTSEESELPFVEVFKESELH